MFETKQQHSQVPTEPDGGSSPGGAVACLTVRIDKKEFPLNGDRLTVLREVSFEVGRGEFVTLLGPSGCGKTTLLRIVAGLDTDYQGRIEFAGQTISHPDRDRAIVFQESRLLPWMSVERNVEFAVPSEVRGDERKRRIEHALQVVGLPEFRTAWPFQLSGGMEKRVALARAIVNLPSLLLLDEPFAALDSFTKFGLQDELARVHNEEHFTTVLVTHDIDEAVYLSDRIAVLSARPATVRAWHTITLPRPRDRASHEFAHTRSAILQEVLNHT